jgi:hypothetical protein
MKVRTGVFCGLALVVFQSSVSLVFAEDYRQERGQARRELTPYFDKQVTIQSTLVGVSGPEWVEQFGPKYKLVGCPDQPVIPADPTKDLSFRTAGPGPWVGAVDGINISIGASDGRTGGSVAYPTNSTARLPDDRKTGPKYEFFFDATLNVRRALVDAAIAEFDRCFSRLPPGNYTDDQFKRLCPYRPVSRDQQKQTCVVSTTGTIGRLLADGTGYEVDLQESTLCDFVGFGKDGSTNTSFTTCYSNSYKGVATVSSKVRPASAKQRFLRSARTRIAKMCATKKSGRQMSNRNIQECVMRQMSKAMAARRR